MPRQKGEMQPPEVAEQVELGKNNRILVKFMRHAERTPEDELTMQGMEETEEIAVSGIETGELDDFNKVKAVGSSSGIGTEMQHTDKNLNEPAAMPRSLGTAHIYGEAAAREGGMERYGSRPRALLGLEDFKNDKPFDWKKEYDAQLPDNYKELNETDKAAAAFKANSGNLNRLLSEKNGEAYRREIAGRYAMFLDRYLRMLERLKSNTKLLVPSGAHGGNMEVFLNEVLKRKKTIEKKSTEQLGFKDVAEIGGAFHPSEGFSVDITTDKNGEQQVQIMMDDQSRMAGEELSLDLDSMAKLVAEHKALYNEEK